jgi:hypothetical protein
MESPDSKYSNAEQQISRTNGQQKSRILTKLQGAPKTANSCLLIPPTTPQYTFPNVHPILFSTESSSFKHRLIANAAGSALFATIFGNVDPLKPKVAISTTPTKTGTRRYMRIQHYGGHKKQVSLSPLSSTINCLK